MNARSIALACSVCILVYSSGCAYQSTQANTVSSRVRSEVPLVDAAQLHQTDKVQALLASGTNVNQKDRWGRTALMAAALVNNSAAVRKLLQRGAKADLKDNGGSTALILAAAGGNTESIRILLHHGADVNQKGHNGVTPLIAAVDSHRIRIGIIKGYPAGAGRPVELVEALKLLLAKGANLHAKTGEGKTALSIAKARQLTKTLKLLRQAGAKY